MVYKAILLPQFHLRLLPIFQIVTKISNNNNSIDTPEVFAKCIGQLWCAPAFCERYFKAKLCTSYDICSEILFISYPNENAEINCHLFEKYYKILRKSEIKYCGIKCNCLRKIQFSYTFLIKLNALTVG